jgi:hypothetical protein
LFLWLPISPLEAHAEVERRIAAGEDLERRRRLAYLGGRCLNSASSAAVETARCDPRVDVGRRFELACPPKQIVACFPRAQELGPQSKGRSLTN